MTEVKIDGKDYVPKAEYDALKAQLGEKKADFVILEVCNVMGIVKVTEDDESITTSNGWKFPKANCCNLIVDLDDTERISCEISKERWVMISRNFYEQATKVFQAWGGDKLKVYAKEKNTPVLLCNGEGLGFILAPRIEQEDA